MPDTFRSGDHYYSIDSFGVIHQEGAKPFVYDAAYAAQYDAPRYQNNARALSAARIGWLFGAFTSIFEHTPCSLVDVGYGNGAFLREASRIIPTTAGKDTSGVPIPPGSIIVEHLNGFDVATFWDSLEHHSDLEFLRTINCKMLAVSVPWYHDLPGEWFENWKHRKPDEHLHHFSKHALGAFMQSMGWETVAWGDHEDLIRTPVDDFPNILSMAFVKS